MEVRVLKKLAIQIATDAHAGQVDKAGVDYILHPLYVASLLEDESEAVQSAAILHDVLEDTMTSAKDLLDAGVPVAVVATVEALTKSKYESYDAYIERVTRDPDAIKVKIADLTHNSDLSRLKVITEKDLDRTAKYASLIEKLRALHLEP